jgi:hypothetical protein
VWFVACSFVAIPSLIMLLRQLGRSRSAIAEARAAARSITVDRKLVAEQALLVALFVAFGLLLNPLGFILATAVFVFVMVFYFERRPIYAAGASVVIAGFIHGLTQVFGLYLPEGPLGF